MATHLAPTPRPSAREVEHSSRPFGSDHMSFLEKGETALLVINSDDEGYPFYHKSGDVLENVDMAYAAKVVRMTHGGMLRIAGLLGVRARGALVLGRGRTHTGPTEAAQALGTGAHRNPMEAPQKRPTAPQGAPRRGPAEASQMRLVRRRPCRGPRSSPTKHRRVIVVVGGGLWLLVGDGGDPKLVDQVCGTRWIGTMTNSEG